MKYNKIVHLLYTYCTLVQNNKMYTLNSLKGRGGFFFPNLENCSHAVTQGQPKL